MIHNLLKNIAKNNNWVFEYGRRDFQNLYNDVDRNQIHLFCDPIATNTTFNEYNIAEKINYSGSFLLLIDSDVDEDYQTKYINHLKPMFDDSLKLIQSQIRCEDLNIENWQSTEAINIFDQNLDGLIITYSISYDK